MKVLHLFSDRRKTGPANPVIEMCKGLMGRGHEVVLAYRAPLREATGRKRGLEQAVKASGVPWTTRFAMNRYFGPIDLAKDMMKLPRYLKRESFDVVHTHLRLDQFLAVTAARMMRAGRPRVVMTMHTREVLPAAGAYKALLRRADGVLTFTPRFRDSYVERFGLDGRRVGVQPMTVDLEKFNPDKTFKEVRAEFGIPPDAVVMGIVGRFQKYRKMEIFLAAAKRVAAKHPEARFLVIGGSRTLRETVREPAQRMGIGDRVIAPGYRGADYADCLAAMDIFTLLMPGSDGTARAVREGMALGKPCVVSDFGMLPEVVPDGEAGLVVRIDDGGESLAAAWSRLIEDAAMRKTMGAAARRIAVERFDPAWTGETLEAFYREVLALPPK